MNGNGSFGSNGPSSDPKAAERSRARHEDYESARRRSQRKLDELRSAIRKKSDERPKITSEIAEEISDVIEEQFDQIRKTMPTPIVVTAQVPPQVVTKSDSHSLRVQLQSLGLPKVVVSSIVLSVGLVIASLQLSRACSEVAVPAVEHFKK